ncbi:MAG: hypothetical protein GY899_02320 [Verrucomicrobiaceae bacterium]|nr:hypothetical protein [Verrucomicrobiaceae bacterium]
MSYEIIAAKHANTLGKYLIGKRQTKHVKEIAEIVAAYDELTRNIYDREEMSRQWLQDVGDKADDREYTGTTCKLIKHTFWHDRDMRG